MDYKKTILTSVVLAIQMRFHSNQIRSVHIKSSLITLCINNNTLLPVYGEKVVDSRGSNIAPATVQNT